jgi:hypothetical protein
MLCACGQHKTPQGCAGARALKALLAELRWRNKPSGRPRASGRTGPLCLCGCGARCHPRAQWASQECVPGEVRAAAMRAGWAKAVMRHRALRFKADIDRLLETGRVSREDLIVFAHAIYRRGYETGLKRGRRGRVA